jgi:hypothetical protein
MSDPTAGPRDPDPSSCARRECAKPIEADDLGSSSLNNSLVRQAVKVRNCSTRAAVPTAPEHGQELRRLGVGQGGMVLDDALGPQGKLLAYTSLTAGISR